MLMDGWEEKRSDGKEWWLLLICGSKREECKAGIEDEGSGDALSRIDRESASSCLGQAEEGICKCQCLRLDLVFHKSLAAKVPAHLTRYSQLASNQ